MPKSSSEENIAVIYSTLASRWGRQHWWPAKSRFEVIVGAYLTQNTSWRNVEIAMRELRAAHVLSVEGIRNISLRRLERLIRSSGYFRQKARKLKTFVKFIDREYRGSLSRMFAQPTTKLREQLLSLNGVGPETADSILLYAGQHPVFVVDAYTRRLAVRHGILNEKASYEEFRSLFERALNNAEHFEFPGVVPSEPLRAGALEYKARVAGGHARSSSAIGSAAHSPSRMSMAKRTPLAQAFNEMHGLIVSAGKQYCLKSKPDCERCPLAPLLPTSRMSGACTAHCIPSATVFF
jgi:endonuclease III related protein